MTRATRRYDLPGVAEAYAHERFQDSSGRRRDRRETADVLELFACIGTHPGTLADMPCGTGRFAGRLPGDLLLAGDLSSEMLRHARERYGRVPLVQASAAHLPLSDRSVDTLFCMRLLHHLRADARRAVLHELHRVARRHALVSIFLGPSLQGMRSRLKRALGRKSSRIAIGRKTFDGDLAATGWRVRAERPRARFVSEQWLFLLEKVEPRSCPSVP